MITSTLTPTSGQARVNHKRAQRALYWSLFPALPSKGGVLMVWDGDRDRWSTSYQSRVMAWLAANGIDSGGIPADSTITASAERITYEVFDDSGVPALAGMRKLHMVPLRVAFTKPEATR